MCRCLKLKDLRGIFKWKQNKMWIERKINTVLRVRVSMTVIFSVTVRVYNYDNYGMLPPGNLMVHDKIIFGDRPIIFIP